MLSFFNALAPYVIIFTYNNPNDWHGFGIILYGIIYPLGLGLFLTLVSLILKKGENGNLKSNTCKTSILSTSSIILVIPIIQLIENLT